MTPRTDVVVDQHHLAQLHGSILALSFPADELVSLAALEQGVRSGRSVVVAASEGGVWLGVAVLERYASGVLLLGYLAVSENARGRGIGGELLRSVKYIVGQEREWLLAEIEPRGTLPERPEFGDPTRRARFYHRAGAKALTVDHWQPPTAPGGPFVRLQLIMLPALGELGETVAASEVLDFEREYLGGQGDSAELRAVVASVGDRGSIELADLAKLYS